MIIQKPNHKTALDEAIESALSELKGYECSDADYAKIMEQLEKLYKLKQLEKHERVSKDTLAVIAGNLAGIFLIVSYERAHVMTSKAIGFVLRAR